MMDHEALSEAMAALPEKQRTAAEMRYYLSMTEEEIAREMGVTQGNISRTLRRAQKKLTREGIFFSLQSDHVSEGEDENQRPGEKQKRGRTVCVPVFPVSLNPPADYLYGSDLWGPFWLEVRAIHNRVLLQAYPRIHTPPRREMLRLTPRPAATGRNRAERRAKLRTISAE